MASTKVSDFLKSQIPVSPQNTVKKDQEGKDSFLNMLQAPNKKLQEMMKTRNAKEETKSSLTNLYAKETQNRKDVISSRNPANGEMPFQEIEKLEAYAEKLEEVLKEAFELSDEEIADCLEVLNLTGLDLLQPNQLLNFVTEQLEITDVSELLVNSDMKLVFDAAKEISASLEAETGISLENLKEFAMQPKVNETMSPETFTELGLDNPKETDAFVVPQTTEALLQEGTIEVPKEMEVETDGMLYTQMETAKTADFSTKSEGIENQPRTMEAVERSDVSPLISKEDQLQDTNEENSAFLNQQEEIFKEETILSQNGNLEEKEDVESQAEFNSFGQMNVQRNEVPQRVETPVAAPQPNVTPEEIMEQVKSFAKLNIQSDTTSIEMQLNPENLGKILIQVSEKAGNLTAKIQTQSELVKAAMENQIISLKTTLEGQGIKVTQVEITVASHEFERNLEQGSMQGGQNPNQQEESASERRQNLNRNDLDNLQGLLTEEEQLVAQMMKDNGNTVDLTA